MSAWLALVVTDVIAVSTFARCFTGPGELTAALVTLLAVHLAGLAARGGVAGMRAPDGLGRGGAGRKGAPEASGAGAGAGGQRRDRRAWWAGGLVAAALLPIVIVLGSTFSWVLPAHATWHAASQDLRGAWRVFSYKVAPVPELPGLVLATAWAAGATALLAEVISSRRKVPAEFALTPALTVYLFAAALGTGSWRVLGLAAMAGATCWYLVAVVRERDSSHDVLVATSETGLSVGDRAASYGAGAVVLRMALLAALAAAVIGPNLPGARSEALVAWHGRGGGGTKPVATAITGGDLPQGIEISTLVQVAEEEIDNPTTPLFTVYSHVPTREVIATLDRFDGNKWTASNTGSPSPSLDGPTFSPSLTALQSHPPAPTPAGSGQEALVQLFQVSELSGYDVPAWGVPLAIADAGEVSSDEGSIVSDTQLEPGLAYAVRSRVPDPTSAQLDRSTPDTSDSQDVQLPQPVPAKLTLLAHKLVVGAKTAYQKALDIQNYFLSGSFVYRLPARTKAGGVVAPLPGYGNLLSFLFTTRTGYCQQYATAFAVLARIDGLPTRIAVGFLSGTPVGKDHDAWQIDGSDTHAWPQVRFAGYGWIDFEPTPGTTESGTTAPTTTTTTTPPGLSTTPTSLARAHNLHPATGGGASHPKGPKPAPRARRPGGSSAPWLLVLPILLLAWAGGIPLWRRLRLRSAGREPRAGILAAWGEALRTLDLAGIRRRRAETYLELARRVASTGVLSDEAELALRDLAVLATTASYAAVPPGHAGARQAMLDARTVSRSARRRVARWQRIAAAMDPRGLPA